MRFQNLPAFAKFKVILGTQRWFYARAFGARDFVVKYEKARNNSPIYLCIYTLRASKLSELEGGLKRVPGSKPYVMYFLFINFAEHNVYHSSAKVTLG